jgi:hypothetical protein
MNSEVLDEPGRVAPGGFVGTRAPSWYLHSPILRQFEEIPGHGDNFDREADGHRGETGTVETGP